MGCLKNHDGFTLQGSHLQLFTLLLYVLHSAFFSWCWSLSFDFNMFEKNESWPKDQLRRRFTVRLTSQGFLGLVKYKHESYDTTPVDLHSSHCKIISQEGNLYNFLVIFGLHGCPKTHTALWRCPVDTNIICHLSGFAWT